MLEEMQKIDTSVIDELLEVKRERETVSSRLSKMGQEQPSVSDVVFHRVKHDYEARLSGLEHKASPLKDRGRIEFAKLKALLDRLDAQHAATRYDKEELEFRHRLGEFEGNEFDTKLAELEEKLKEQQAQLGEAGALRGRFADSFDSEAELMAASATPAQEEAPPAPPPGAEEAAAPPAPDAVGSAESTVMLPIAAAEAAPAKAAALAVARLVAVDADLGASEFPLQAQTFVGRTPDNHVRINKPTVSRRHAQLSQTGAVWSVRDLRSENGTYVNGEKVVERNLNDGDRVNFGTVRLVFRAG